MGDKIEIGEFIKQNYLYCGKVGNLRLLYRLDAGFVLGERYKLVKDDYFKNKYNKHIVIGRNLKLLAIGRRTKYYELQQREKAQAKTIL